VTAASVPPAARELAEPTPSHAEYGWLPAVVPVDATRFRAADPGIARTLRYAGARIVEEGAEVDLGAPGQIGGTARVAVVSVNTVVANVPSRLGQAVRRVARSAEARVRAEAARRALRRSGYDHVEVVPWDVEQVLRLPGMPRAPQLRASERLPRRAVVVATHGAPSPTAFEAAAAAAAAAAGDTSAASWPLVRAGSLVTLSAASVLRVALGPARERIDRQAAVLATLAAAPAGARLAGRVPAPIATGDAGLARWSVERRLPGEPAPERIPPALLADCLDFLAALERCEGTGGGVSSGARAEALGRLLPHHAAELAAAGASVDAATSSLGRVFGHGDFWFNNLLVEGGRLSGVVDWEAAGPGRLPLLDLFQLTIVERMAGDPYGWGRAIVEHLLPACRAGGDALTRRYLAQTGRDLRPSELEALALAYWLDRAASQLTAHVGRLGDRAWLAANVDLVLAAARGRVGDGPA
jgi:Phosphotransferase enzyme family